MKSLTNTHTTNLFNTLKKANWFLLSNNNITQKTLVVEKTNAMDVHDDAAAANEENKENQVKSSWKRHEEHQYLDQIRHLINYGKTRLDRTGKKKTSIEFSLKIILKLFTI